MMIVNAPSLLNILRSVSASGRAGETELDALIRAASYDEDVRGSVMSALAEVADQLTTPVEWQSIQVLVVQLGTTDTKLGERIVARIDNGALTDLAALWAAHAAVALGATLKLATLAALQQARCANPVLWFSLMRDTQAINAVISCLQSLAAIPELTPQNALNVIRAFKRWAIQSGVQWNVPLSNFLSALPDAVENEVSAKIAKSLGPSFSVEAIATPPLIVEVIDPPPLLVTKLYDCAPISQAMEKVMISLDYSHLRALEPA